MVNSGSMDTGENLEMAWSTVWSGLPGERICKGGAMCFPEWDLEGRWRWERMRGVGRGAALG